MSDGSEIVEILRYAGAVLGLGGGSAGGYLLAKFNKFQEDVKGAREDAKHALDVVRDLRRQWREYQRLGLGTAPKADEDRDSQTDLTQQSYAARLNTIEQRMAQLEIDIRTERTQRHALEKECREFLNREATKWLEIKEALAEARADMRSILRDLERRS